MLWSNRMRISYYTCSAGRNRRRIEAAGCKSEYFLNLLPRHVILFDDLFNTRPRFEIFKD